MSGDQEARLADALRSAFDEMIPDFEPSDDLRTRVDRIAMARPNRIHRHAGRIRFRVSAGMAGIAAVGAVAAALISQSAVPASFAVTVQANRSVKVTLYGLRGAAGANARLRALGVRARIVPIRSGCSTRVELSYLGINERPAPTLDLIPREIAAGSTLVLAAERIGSNHVEMAFGLVRGPAPACVRSGKGPGLTGVRHHSRRHGAYSIQPG